jgi:hypothetical protein
MKPRQPLVSVSSNRQSVFSIPNTDYRTSEMVPIPAGKHSLADERRQRYAWPLSFCGEAFLLRIQNSDAEIRGEHAEIHGEEQRKIRVCPIRVYNHLRKL